LEATARLIKSGAAYLLLAQTVRRQETTLVEGEIKIVCVDKNSLAPRRMPRQLLASLRG